MPVRVPEPPGARIVSPAGGNPIPLPATVALEAEVAGKESPIRTVSFFVDGKPLTEASAAGNGRFRAAWEPKAAGTYRIHAEAVDLRGIKGTSAPVSVTCAFPPPPTAAFLAPVRGAFYELGETISIVISASASATTHVVRIDPPIFTLSPDGTYRGTWTPIRPGTTKLTVAAWDNYGQSGIAELEVTVASPGPALFRIVEPSPGSTYGLGSEVEVQASILSRVGPVAAMSALPTAHYFVPLSGPPPRHLDSQMDS